MTTWILRVAVTAILAGGCAPAARAPQPVSPAERHVARFLECWAFFDREDYDAYKACFAADAILELPGFRPPVIGGDAIANHHIDAKAAFPDRTAVPQLVLANGRQIVSIVHMAGTQTRPRGTLPATNKRFGILLAHALEVNDANEIAREWELFDFVTALGQLGHSPEPARPVTETGLGTKRVVIAKGDATEEANLAAFGRVTAAFNAHEANALRDSMATDAASWIAPLTTDLATAETIETIEALWKQLPDGTVTVTTAWAAGNYVVAFASFDGVEAASGKRLAVPAMTVHELAGGKIKATWVFFQRMGVKAQLAR